MAIEKSSLWKFYFPKESSVMPTISAHNLNRFTTAFIDYNLACAKFHEAVYSIAKNETITLESIEDLTRNLNIKHAYYLQCAQRITIKK